MGLSFAHLVGSHIVLTRERFLLAPIHLEKQNEQTYETIVDCERRVGMMKKSLKRQRKNGSKGEPSAKGSEIKTIDIWGETDLKRLNKNLTGQVFISSLNRYPLRLLTEDKSTLSDFR